MHFPEYNDYARVVPPLALNCPKWMENAQVGWDHSLSSPPCVSQWSWSCLGIMCASLLNRWVQKQHSLGSSGIVIYRDLNAQQSLGFSRSRTKSLTQHSLNFYESWVSNFLRLPWKNTDILCNMTSTDISAFWIRPLRGNLIRHSLH